jgi:predicted ATP-dependent endonuclease of OLD family
MRLKRLVLSNFRCFKDLVTDFGRYNCFIGQNNSGKSTILAALNIFFESSPRNILISENDFLNKEEELRIAVSFTELDEDALNEFSHYYRNGELTFHVIAKISGGSIEKSIRGIRHVMPAFKPFFESSKAQDRKDFYNSIKDDFSLPAWTNKDAAEATLREYEESHPELCEPAESSDDAFGATGPAHKLRRYVEWIYVPAIKDAAQEQLEAKNSAFGKLVTRAIRSKLELTKEIETIKSEAHQKLISLVESRRPDLNDLAKQIDLDFKSLTSLDVNVHLDWSADDTKNVSIVEPPIKSLLDDGGYRGDVSSFGHGLQRNYLIALLQLNAKLADGEPRLILACEEPELYQHPPQIRYLHEVLRDLSNDNQILLTTHSPHFVSARDFGGITIIRKQGNCSQVFTHSVEAQRDFIAKSKGEAPIGHAASEATLDSFLHSEVAELFFCERAILVEGAEDKALLNTFLEIRGLRTNFLKAGGHIVSVGGKGCFIQALALAHGYKLPVLAVFDADTGCGGNKIADTKALNAQIIRMCSFNQKDPDESECWPTTELYRETCIIWPEDIQKSISADWPDWYEECRSLASQFGWTYDRLKKNPTLMEAAMRAALSKGAKLERFERMTANIISFFNSSPSKRIQLPASQGNDIRVEISTTKVSEKAEAVSIPIVDMVVEDGTRPDA